MGGERFEYSVHEGGSKGSRVRVFWEGRCVCTVAGDRAAKLLAKLDGATDEAAQELLRRLTGNFKRGNERG